jgi:hypothetical protein
MPSRPQPSRKPVPTPQPAAADYEAIWGRLEERVEREWWLLAAERQAAPALLGELLRLPPAERRRTLRHERRFHSVGLVEALIRQGRGTGEAEPLWTALDLLEQLDRRAHSTVRRMLRGEALCALGEIGFANGDRTAAAACLAGATAALAASPDPAPLAGLAALRAALSRE